MSDLDLTLPGRSFATAWLNTWLSTGDDEARPALYRTVLCEVFTSPRCLQLVATDSYTLFGSTAACSGHEDDSAPTLDELPDRAIVVMDHDARVQVLMRWLLADCKHAAKNGLMEPTVHVALRSAEVPSTPTLDPSMGRQQLVITTDRERLTLDVFDGGYPAWRPLLLPHKPKSTEGIAFSPRLLARLGKIRTVDAEPIEFTMAGPIGLSVFTVRTEPPVFGGIMPVRVGAEVAS